MSLPVKRRTPTLALVLSNAIAADRMRLHTAMPAAVVRYDPVLQVIDAQPLVMGYLLDDDNDATPTVLPQVNNVPVLFQGANGFRITLPIAVGDTVELLCQEASIDAWLNVAGTTPIDPMDARRHHITDAVAIPGLHPNTKPWTNASLTAMTLGADAGPQVVVRQTGIELGGTDTAPPTDFVALASLVLAQLSAIVGALNQLVLQFNINAALYSAHVHSSFTTPPVAPMVPGVAASAPTTVAAAQVKAQ